MKVCNFYLNTKKTIFFKVSQEVLFQKAIRNEE
jgi:hypothetical protein